MARVSVAAAHELVVRALVAAGAKRETAVPVADNILFAQASGVVSHGLTWARVFADQVRSGKVDGRAEAEVTQVAPAGLVVDARDGLPMAAIARGLDRLIPLARETGIAAMAVRNSGNCLLVGQYVDRLARAGLVGLGFVNSPKSMAPWGGKAPVFGTNPMAFACPRPDGEPVVLDMSSSRVARSEIRLAMEEGRPIPGDWALDRDGNPTTDAAAAWAGSVLPFGGHKGSGIAMMVDLLAGALTGARLGHEAAPYTGDTTAPSRTGHFFVAIRPETFGGDGVLDRFEALFGALAGQEGVGLPGDRRKRSRAAAERDGLEIPDALHAQLTALAEG